MKVIKFSSVQRQELADIVSKFKTYSNFSKNKKSAYKYAEIFKISICPYCNIHYIDTILNVTRPEFDHFVPKSSNAGKGKELDIDNLIPSCHICNAIIKKTKLFQISTHIHPFYDDFDSIMKFCIDIKSASYIFNDGFDILFFGTSSDDNVKRAFKSIEDLKLYARYQVHKNHVIEILKFVKHYNACHTKQVYELLGINNKETSTLYDLFSTYIDIDINKISLGKLRRDILATYIG